MTPMINCNPDEDRAEESNVEECAQYASADDLTEDKARLAGDAWKKSTFNQLKRKKLLNHFLGQRINSHTSSLIRTAWQTRGRTISNNVYCIDWCCFCYFVRNSLVALLEALCTNKLNQELLSSWNQDSVYSDHKSEHSVSHTSISDTRPGVETAPNSQGFTTRHSEQSTIFDLWGF